MIVDTKLGKLNRDSAYFRNTYLSEISFGDDYNTRDILGVNANNYSLALDTGEKISKLYSNVITKHNEYKDNLNKLQMVATEKEKIAKLRHPSLKYIKEDFYDSHNTPHIRYAIAHNGQTIYSTEVDATMPKNILEVTSEAINQMTSLEFDMYVKRYLEIKNDLENGKRASFFNSTTKALENEINTISVMPTVNQYIKLSNARKELDSLSEELTNRRFGNSYASIIRDINDIKHDYKSYTKPIIERLENATDDILTLALLNLVKKNDQAIQESDNPDQLLESNIAPTNYKEIFKLRDLINNYKNNIDTYNLASVLFEVSKKSLYNKNGQQNVEKWVKVKNEKYLSGIYNQLPNNIRNKDGYEINLTDSKFEELSLDWQLGNYELAKVIKTLVKDGVNMDNVKNNINKSNWLYIKDNVVMGANINLDINVLNNSQILNKLIMKAETFNNSKSTK